MLILTAKGNNAKGVIVIVLTSKIISSLSVSLKADQRKAVTAR